MQLVVVDTTRIQPYVFGSNHLRENIGASYLVAQATEAWGFEAVDGVAGCRHNATRAGGDWDLDDDARIEDGHLDAEVVYAGGGNFVVLFRDGMRADGFIRRLSLRVLAEAPGLRLVFGRSDCEWERSGSLAQAVEAAFKDAARAKRSTPPSAPLLGLAVTKMCSSTGLPAVRLVQGVGADEDLLPASAEIHAKLLALEAADDRLRRVLPPPEGFEYPKDLGHLGPTRHEASFVAVVHADGDGMSERVRRIGEEHGASPNRDYLLALRRFSRSVNAAARKALEQTLDTLMRRIDPSGAVIAHGVDQRQVVKIQLHKSGSKASLPFRPLILGGDDVAFVCDGRLGLSLTAEYLRRFEEASARLPAGGLTASAGVAIVKSHYPFARAYTLAEELCRSAKAYRSTVGKGSFLDWHFALTGVTGHLEELREREFRVSGGELNLRPLCLGDNPNEPMRTWRALTRALRSFQGEEWAGRRNKVKALRTALREGPDAVQRFLEVFDLQGLPDLCSDLSDLPRRGWHGGRCAYFDAIELADHFVPFGEDEEEGNTA